MGVDVAMSDVTLQGAVGSSIVTFLLNTEEAREWASECVEPYLPDYMGHWNEQGTLYMFHAESRYAYDIAEGMAEDGLTFD